jgi:plastocyanin
VTGAGVAAATEGAHAAASTVKLKADPGGQIKFNKSKLSAAHGKVTITLQNPSSSGSPHGIAITGHGLNKKGKVVNPGKSTKVTATLKKGKYTYYCPVPGHRQLGMKGTITIK